MSIQNYVYTADRETIRRYLSVVVYKFRNLSPMVQLAAAYLFGIIVVGLLGPEFAPYEPGAQHLNDDGSLRNTEAPSRDHWLGTTNRGEDVFSRLVVGARPTVIAGLLGGGIVITIGVTVGVIAGYFGGKIDSVLMRFTDLVYGVPVIPTAIVLAAFFGTGFITSIIAIGLVLWRGAARVIRSQVLQIKQRPFVQAAQATGASTERIIFRHIFPNVITMAILFFALAVADVIIIQAGLAFIGISDPFVPSWGIMLRNAYQGGALGRAFWWSIPPGVLIATTVLASYTIGRSLESKDTNANALTN